ncbi:DUF3817 domain-containing protein [Leptothoe sp. LEGE 181152]|nr:DUF3817 domain-containing protein [Leptothoe sp. LEGE 181152]
MEDDRLKLISTLQSNIRIAAVAEGVSLLALLLVAVPLKRLADLEIATAIASPCHGFFLVVYLVLLIEAVAAEALPILVLLLAVVVAPIPFATFIIERKFVSQINQESE